MNDEQYQPQSTEEVRLIIKTAAVSVISSIVVVLLFLQFVPGHILERLIYRTENKSDSISIVQPSPLQSADTIPDVVESITPAVVSVIITADVPIIERYYEEFNPFDFFGRGFGFQVPRQRQLGTEKREVGGGSGFIVSQDGYIVTNRHVVDIEGAEFSILMNDGVRHDARVIAKDPTLDIAILKVEGTEFPYLTFGEDSSVRLGSTVIAVGNALAEFPNSVSVGVVSGLSRTIEAGDMMGFTEVLEGVIQTDAAINQGNSGGPLLNASGEVIGINVAVAGNSENIGFALPAGPVKNIVESVREYGEIRRPFVGIRYVHVTEGIAAELDLPVTYGVLVSSGGNGEPAVIPDSPADVAGILENDIITKVNGTSLEGNPRFATLIREFSIGENILLTVQRGTKEETITVTLSTAPKE